MKDFPFKIIASSWDNLNEAAHSVKNQMNEAIQEGYIPHGGISVGVSSDTAGYVLFVVGILMVKDVNIDPDRYKINPPGSSPDIPDIPDKPNIPFKPITHMSPIPASEQDTTIPKDSPGSVENPPSGNKDKSSKT